jgi:hypothetical protein
MVVILMAVRVSPSRYSHIIGIEAVKITMTPVVKI